jgi:ribosome-binding protein aMBF1 (putative translation factor)
MNFQQDWDPVVFSKKPPIQKKGPAGILKVLKDQEVFRHKDIPKSLVDRIRARRVELKMTQEQLANRINVRPVIVKNIESCIGPYDHVNINKIMKAIGLTLKSDS